MSNKKLVILFALFLVFLAITLVGGFAIKEFSKQNVNKALTKLLTEGEVQYKQYIPEDRFQKSLSDLNNSKLSSKERYKALSDLIFYFGDAYGRTNDPAVRKYLLSLSDPAKKAFPKDYIESTFIITCADPECGEKTSPEISKLIIEVQNLSVDNVYKNTISRNLKIASNVPYVTDDNKQDKLGSFRLAYGQLLSLNNPQASAAAGKLKIYIKNKYNKDL